MQSGKDEAIIAQYIAQLSRKEFPCIGAKAALSGGQVQAMVATHMACPHDDAAILAFLYRFIADYRAAESPFHSAAIIFRGPQHGDEQSFETLLWQRLQALSDLDAQQYPYDPRVESDPDSADFSFSIGSEGFYIIGLHPFSSRVARRFSYPTLVFNPHAQFELLRASGQYERIKQTVRRRDVRLSGSVNPMLDDFGASAETRQYSGRILESDWKCPLIITHAGTTHHPAP